MGGCPVPAGVDEKNVIVVRFLAEEGHMAVPEEKVLAADKVAITTAIFFISKGHTVYFERFHHSHVLSTPYCKIV